MLYKKVYLPIEVPEGKYCWGWGGSSHPPCEYFSNDGRCEKCDNGFYNYEYPKIDKIGILKPKKCLELKDCK